MEAEETALMQGCACLLGRLAVASVLLCPTLVAKFASGWLGCLFDVVASGPKCAVRAVVPSVAVFSSAVDPGHITSFQ
jgi:hypothetical protein